MNNEVVVSAIRAFNAKIVRGEVSVEHIFMGRSADLIAEYDADEQKSILSMTLIVGNRAPALNELLNRKLVSDGLGAIIAESDQGKADLTMMREDDHSGSDAATYKVIITARVDGILALRLMDKYKDYHTENAKKEEGTGIVGTLHHYKSEKPSGVSAEDANKSESEISTLGDLIDAIGKTVFAVKSSVFVTSHESSKEATLNLSVFITAENIKGGRYNKEEAANERSLDLLRMIQRDYGRKLQLTVLEVDDGVKDYGVHIVPTIRELVSEALSLKSVLETTTTGEMPMSTKDNLYAEMEKDILSGIEKRSNRILTPESAEVEYKVQVMNKSREEYAKLQAYLSGLSNAELVKTCEEVMICGVDSDDYTRNSLIIEQLACRLNSEQQNSEQQNSEQKHHEDDEREKRARLIAEANAKNHTPHKFNATKEGNKLHLNLVIDLDSETKGDKRMQEYLIAFIPVIFAETAGQYVTMAQKNYYYGSGNIERSGEIGIAVRAGDKTGRLFEMLSSSGRDAVFNESKKDTWKDLHGYSLIGVCFISGAWQKAIQSAKNAVQSYDEMKKDGMN